MMYFRDREEQDNAIKKIIEDYRTAAALCTRIKPIIAAFDGKVYNCRLVKKLAEIGRIYCKKTEYYFSIYVYIGNCYSSQLTLCNLPVEKAIICKRIQSENLLTECNNRREELLKKAYDLEEKTKLVNIYQQRFEELRREIEKLNGSLPYELKTIYNLDYHLKKG